MLCNFKAMNKRQYLIITFALGTILSIMMLSFKYVDFSQTEYLLKGKIYFDGRPLKSDSVYFVNIPTGEKPSERYTKTLKTDAEGNYEETVRCTGYCMSVGSYNACKKKGVSQEDCFWYMTKKLNADSWFSFIIKREFRLKIIMLKQLLNCKRMDMIRESNLRLRVTLSSNKACF